MTSAEPDLAFLSGPAPESVATRVIDFNETDVDICGDYFAMVIEDLFTPEECSKLLALVRKPDNAPWPPAVVTAFDGSQHVDVSSRHCGRIIYYSTRLAEKLLQRVVPHLPPEIVTLENHPDVTGQYPVLRGETWTISRFTEDIKFLKYEPGNYFRAHADGRCVDVDTFEKSYLTVHIYLGGGDEDDGVEGGATRFAVDFQDPKAGKVDVNPKTGSAVVFQQRDLYHSGEEVTKGTKYTLRTDVMYKKIEETLRINVLWTEWYPSISSISVSLHAASATTLAAYRAYCHGEIHKSIKTIKDRTIDGQIDAETTQIFVNALVEYAKATDRGTPEQLSMIRLVFFSPGASAGVVQTFTDASTVTEITRVAFACPVNTHFS
ncbi:Uu.00g006370.m01.CDS01 [Anthostomella pinea]|uniref:Uu.00g006370.m01.CDS01 n=1 Tax=Anthostomella pinea TaxID=933095 RepID=A0AAI8VL03_9PEZI|nr:Uu.00g006370.m01.CDS01 [Anthostomella pinea]